MTQRSYKEVEAMYRLYMDEELSLRKLGERYDLTGQRIQQLFVAYGFQPRAPGSARRLDRLNNERKAEEMHDDIIRLYKQYGNIDVVVAEVNLPRWIVAKVADEIPNRESYRRRGKLVLRTEEQLILDLQFGATIAGEPLTIPAYRVVATKYGLASDLTQRRHFGTWLKALDAANVKGNPSRGEYLGTISQEECLKALRRYQKAQKQRPSYTRYTEWAKAQPRKKWAPSGPTVRMKFGGWNEAMEAFDEMS